MQFFTPVIGMMPPPPINFAAARSSRGGPQTSSEVAPGATVDNGRGTQYRVLQELGAGCFGTVSKVQRVSDGKVLAIKFQTQRDSHQVGEVQKEVGLLNRLRHANIVSFFEDFQFHRYICIVMEYCDGGTLAKHIQSRKPKGFSTLRLAGYMAQLASGLEFIHSRNVTHRDLKSENVMMTSKMDLKISDFGCGKTLPSGSSCCMTMTGGDRMIIPPEMAHRIQGVPQHGMVGPAYDMWGLGVILCELLTLKLMSRDICKQTPLCLNRAAEVQILSESKQVHDGKFHALLQSLLQHDPNRRAKATDVKSSVKVLLRPEVKADTQQLKKTAQKLGVPESQLSEAWEHFQKADTGSRGCITVGQLKTLLNILHVDVSARALMKQFDKEVTGTLDFTEFARWWLKRNQDWMPTVIAGERDTERVKIVSKVFGIPPADYEKLRDVFKACDTDNSGDISALAVYAVLRQVGVNMGSDLQPLIDAIGPEWQERTFTFDDLLQWCKDNVDWTAKALISPSTGRARRSPSRRRGHSSTSPPPSAPSSAPVPAPVRPSTSPPISGRSTPVTGGNGSPRFHKGQKVLVYRSSGDWSPAEVTEVKTDRVMVTYTHEDKGSKKEIHNSLLDQFLKRA